MNDCKQVTMSLSEIRKCKDIRELLVECERLFVEDTTHLYTHDSVERQGDRIEYQLDLQNSLPRFPQARSGSTHRWIMINATLGMTC
jgi:hypothetical protein